MRPPAQEVLPFLGDDPLEEALADLCWRRVGRGEERADAVLLGLGQLDPQRRQRRGQELVGDLDQDARAVAGVVLAAAGTAMVHVVKRRQAVADKLCDFRPFKSTMKPTPQLSCS